MQPRKRHTHAQKRAWILARLTAKWELEKKTSNPPLRPFICAMEPNDQEAWFAEFGGQIKIYWVGPDVSPDFARTLRRMFVAGDLRRSTQGNQEAKFYCQKTWTLSYTFAKWPPPETD